MFIILQKITIYDPLLAHTYYPSCVLLSECVDPLFTDKEINKMRTIYLVLTNFPCDVYYPGRRSYSHNYTLNYD